MKFLVPSAGKLDPRFGILTSWKHSTALGVSEGLPWAADLGCIEGPDYVKKYNPEKSIPWLETMRKYRSTCLFVAVPDYVGDAERTLEEFPRHIFPDWPLAFVAQDGQEKRDFPPEETWETLFLGGSTLWKMSDAAVDCIRRAQALKKRIHIGRVNRYRRYKHFRSLEGSEGFTCDGTRIKYGRDETLKDWLEYMDRPRQFNLFIPDSDHRSESINREIRAEDIDT